MDVERRFSARIKSLDQSHLRPTIFWFIRREKTEEILSKSYELTSLDQPCSRLSCFLVGWSESVGKLRKQQWHPASAPVRVIISPAHDGYLFHLIRKSGRKPKIYRWWMDNGWWFDGLDWVPMILHLTCHLIHHLLSHPLGYLLFVISLLFIFVL